MHHHNSNLNAVARNLRKHPTEAENELWYKFLRGYRPRFQRQKSILRFIADFYCAKARLVVEIDGGYHNDAEQAELDAARTEIIETLGIKVIRFTNEELKNAPSPVALAIDRAVKERLSEELNYSQGKE